MCPTLVFHVTTSALELHGEPAEKPSFYQNYLTLHSPVHVIGLNVSLREGYVHHSFRQDGWVNVGTSQVVSGHVLAINNNGATED